MNSILVPIAMSSALLAELPSLTGLYLIALIVGGGLLVISMLFGGDADSDLDLDADLEADFEADADLDVDAGGIHGHAADGALSLANWFSVRFLIYAAAMFGLVGTVLTYMSDYGGGPVLAMSAIGGAIVGQCAHQAFRYLKRSSSDSSTAPKDYVDKPARVTVAIHPPAKGEIALQIEDDERYLPAVAKRGEDAFEAGQQVAVVELRGGTAVVVSRKEFEFVNEP